jgi:hypothetical protein
MARLSDHDRQALALAKCYPWVCHNCFAGLDSDGKLEPWEAQMNAERSYYLGVIQTLRSIETVKTLLEVCEELRAIFAAGSEMRYAWSGVAPELLHELWGVMDKIGGTIPPRPEAAKSNPSASEAYIQSILDALNDVVRWCKQPTTPSNSLLPARNLAAGMALANALHPMPVIRSRARDWAWRKDPGPTLPAAAGRGQGRVAPARTDMLTVLALEAVNTLFDLQKINIPCPVRLGAAKGFGHFAFAPISDITGKSS